MTAIAALKEQLSAAEGWQAHLKGELEQDYMHRLVAFLDGEIAAGKDIYPQTADWLQALQSTPLNAVKVVILGQDPYHQPGQAHGLSFSVQPGVKVPPSLRNMYKELATDLQLPEPDHGFLQHWAEQGVLLLNTVLTVEYNKAGSHQKKGWEPFTDRIIETVNSQCDGVVFVLWGSHAQKKAAMIDSTRHRILESVHPSPLSAFRGFFGSRPFSQINEYLEASGRTPVEWQLESLEAKPDQGALF
ncbi:uracil-DNA glycosylase [Aliamphritea hakodatensis]|uniref:uracil-DNA glycosylase n=1 Tax=Aliamphritea hakodatensis TaxID=2895352 RepID=UPI0022FD3BDF|nr:uracil-DNA glycosylase [Aliamphritea hakodatensis]